MTAVEIAEDEIADLVREDFKGRESDYFYVGGRRFNKAMDDAVKSVAARLGLDWRPVLRAYRAKYPLRKPLP